MSHINTHILKNMCEVSDVLVFRYKGIVGEKALGT